MSTQIATFNTEYSGEIIKMAAYAFRDYQFERYGRLLIGACLVNAIGLSSAIWFGAPFDFPLYTVIFVVAFVPIWLLYKFFVAPRTRAAMFRLILAETGHVTIESESIALPTHRGEMVIPWNRVRIVVEKDTFFLLILSPVFFYFVPKVGMPQDAYENLRLRPQSKLCPTQRSSGTPQKRGAP